MTPTEREFFSKAREEAPAPQPPRASGSAATIAIVLVVAAAVAAGVVAWPMIAGIGTIEQAESFAKSHGVPLSGKKENTAQAVAERAFDYQSGDVGIEILQFRDTDAVKGCRELMSKMPMFFGKMIMIEKGRVVFYIQDGPDDQRQRVAAALR